MPRLFGRKYTAMKDIKVTRATRGFMINVPVECIVEKQIDREIIGICGSSRTIFVSFDVTPERVDECMSPKSLLVQQKNEGGNIYFVIRTSKVKEKCSGFLCHFGRGFSNGKSLRIVADEGILRKLIYSLTEGPHAHRAFLRFLRPITGLLHGSEEDSHSLPRSDWSSLPLLLLWMIMDRLDFFSNAKVALICRHWRHGSRNNPNKMQTIGDGIPWIMLNPSAKGNTNKCAREFINFERSKKFVVELPEFYKSYLLFSRRGWILLGRRNLRMKDQIVASLFLINPLTKGKIEVGDVVIDREGSLCRHFMGCFSTNQDGFPDCVVIYYNHFDVNKISLYITYLGGGGDQVWTRQSYAVKGFRVINHGMAVINSHVYIFCYGGVVITYDMGGQTWKEIPAPLLESVVPTLQFMEHEGHVGLFGYYGQRWLFKYSHTHNCWQRLTNDEANNLSLFGNENSTYLTARMQSGLNVHSLEPDKGNARLNTTDYLLGAFRSFILHNRGAYWVYIG